MDFDIMAFDWRSRVFGNSILAISATQTWIRSLPADHVPKGGENPGCLMSLRGRMAEDLASLRNFVIRPCLCLDHHSQEARTKCRTWTDALLQEIILKANSVKTGGDQTARTMRSSLVEEVSRICKSLDAAVSDDIQPEIYQKFRRSASPRSQLIDAYPLKSRFIRSYVGNDLGKDVVREVFFA